MTEPVAYFNKFKNYSSNVTQQKVINNRMLLSSKPLYTSEQLHPRVKMTHAEFDEFSNLYGEEYGGNGNVFFGLDKAINLENFYPNLNARLITDKQFDDNFAQAEFVNLWIKFDPSHPEELIEIVPEMKWFVRSKEPETEDGDEHYLFLSGSNLDDLDYLEFDYAKAFNTKEEAEKWTNPFTEAVQLPVEDE